MDNAMEIDTVSPHEMKGNSESLEVVTNWVPHPTENHYTFGDGSRWIMTCWDESTSTPERLNEFYQRWPPSLTPESYGAWISADRGGYTPQIPDVQGLRASFHNLLNSNEPVTTIKLDAIAMQHNCLVGKWLVFTDWQRVDSIWARIVNFVCLKRQKGNVKVSTRKEKKTKKINHEGVEVVEEEGHVICIYIEDYMDTEEVKAVRNALQGIGIRWKIGFKPDAYTYLGIYSKNPWNISPTRYFY